MSNNKQSSVDWLINHITHDQMVKSKSLNEWLEIFQQAKEMHKQEIIRPLISMGWSEKIAESYYNVTYGGTNE